MQKYFLDPSSQVILISALIVGPRNAHNIRLILDTGASFTLISPEILVRVGLDPVAVLNKRPITTASGIEYVPFLKIPTLQLLGVERHDVEVCAHSLPSNLPARGLLGLNFLRHFNLHLNFLDKELKIFAAA